MAKIHICVCLNKIMGNNAVSVSDHLLYLSGKAIEAFIKEPAYAPHAVKIKICVKYAL